MESARTKFTPKRLEDLKRPIYPEIADEIAQMVIEDQTMRVAMIKNPKAWDANVDKRNTERLKVILDDIVWPTISAYGKVTASNTWLLVQHADHDVDFQEGVLNTMIEIREAMGESETEEVSAQDLAMLTDRVRVNRKMPQIYGSQLKNLGGVLVPQPIQNPENVDALRAQMGLMPLEKFIKRCSVHFGQQKKLHLPHHANGSDELRDILPSTVLPPPVS